MKRTNGKRRCTKEVQLMLEMHKERGNSRRLSLIKDLARSVQMKMFVFSLAVFIIAATKGQKFAQIKLKIYFLQVFKLLRN